MMALEKLTAKQGILLVCMVTTTVTTIMGVRGPLRRVLYAVETEKAEYHALDDHGPHFRNVSLHNERFSQRHISPRSQVGSWMGNNWIPPPEWRLFSQQELKDLFAQKSLAFWGDSTARRAAATMHMLLDPTYTDLQKDQLDNLKVLDQLELPASNCPKYGVKAAEFGEICRVVHSDHNNTSNATSSSTTTTSGLSILSWSLHYCMINCIAGLNKMRKALRENGNTFQQHSDILVLGVGTWDEGQKGTCGRYHINKDNYTESMLHEVHELLDLADKYVHESGKRIIWRTSGFFQSNTAKADPQTIHILNKAAMDAIDAMNNPRVTYVNYGTAVQPRSSGKARIDGGHVAHYGWEARMVLVQMLANHLMDLGELHL